METEKAIHEFTRNDSKQSLYFVPFRVNSWIAFLHCPPLPNTAKHFFSNC